MSKVRWGILGTANIARWAAIPGMQQAESCDLYAIAGRNAEKAARFAENYGFRKSCGSYDELIARGGFFAKLVERQRPEKGE